MRNDRSAFQKVNRAIGKRAAMRSIFAAAIILSASTVVGHAREVSQYAEIQPGQNRIADADPVPPDENNLTKMIEEENARLDRLVKGICRGC
jgi:hypothetical protein